MECEDFGRAFSWSIDEREQFGRFFCGLSLNDAGALLRACKTRLEVAVVKERERVTWPVAEELFVTAQRYPQRAAATVKTDSVAAQKVAPFVPSLAQADAVAQNPTMWSSLPTSTQPACTPWGGWTHSQQPVSEGEAPISSARDNEDVR